MIAETQMTRGETASGVKVRVHGPASRPTLIYLPGMHGSWALAGGFRRVIGPHVRFVEVTYPPTLTWSLAEYAAAVESALMASDIRGGWLLGESFGSQVVWWLIGRKRLAIEGVVLAGGFGRHPAPWEARLARVLLSRVPLSMLHGALGFYALISKLRFRNDPATVDEIRRFIPGFDEQERRAAVHRLRLVADNEPRELVQGAGLPVYAVSGLWDPVVPWHGARAWLRRHCPTLKDHRIIWHADHNVLGTASETTARLVLRWMAGGVGHRPL